MKMVSMMMPGYEQELTTLIIESLPKEVFKSFSQIKKESQSRNM